MASKKLKKILTVVGARPQFIKICLVSKLIKKISNKSKIHEVVVHTGQHYDKSMSNIFFKELNIQKPKYNLNIGSDLPHKQLSKMIDKIGRVISIESPNVVLVYGDTISTLAAALASAINDIPLIHVEAGERYYRRHKLPEETNRVLADHISTLSLTSSQRAKSYLYREGFSKNRIKFVGDLMYDVFLENSKKYKKFSKISLKELNLHSENYILATIHRQENTLNKKILFELLNVLDASNYKVVLPLHPRVSKILKAQKYKPKHNLILIPSLGYFDFMNLLFNCKKVFTDSGGVMREAFFAKKPSIVPLESSCWPEIIESGWAKETGNNLKKILNLLNNFSAPRSYVPGLFGNGKSHIKIVAELVNFVNNSTWKESWNRHGDFKKLPKNQTSDFTLSNYKLFMKRLINSGYKTIFFNETNKFLKKSRPFILLRHDIDFSPENALTIAELESKMGIKSTFFIMLKTDFYNIFSKENSNNIKKILKFGHKIGLHFDCSAYKENISNYELSKLCQKEKKILENWFNTSVDIISFHRPNKNILSGNPKVSYPTEHTYIPKYTKKIKYFSDSRGRWKFGHPLDSLEFKKRRPMQLLIHPIWWRSKPTSSFNTLEDFVDLKNKKMKYLLSQNVDFYNFNYSKNKT